MEVGECDGEGGGGGEEEGPVAKGAVPFPYLRLQIVCACVYV